MEVPENNGWFQRLTDEPKSNEDIAWLKEEIFYYTQSSQIEVASHQTVML